MVFWNLCHVIRGVLGVEEYTNILRFENFYKLLKILAYSKLFLRHFTYFYYRKLMNDDNVLLLILKMEPTEILKFN